MIPFHPLPVDRALILVVERSDSRRYREFLVLEMLLADDLARRVRILKSRGSQHDGRRRPLRITQDGISVD